MKLSKKKIVRSIAVCVFEILPLMFFVLGIFAIIFYGIGFLPANIPATMIVVAPFVALFAIAGSDLLYQLDMW